MKLRVRFWASCVIILSFVSYSLLSLHGETPRFGARVDCGEIEFPAIDEASGLAASRKNPGILWTHNDSGNRRIFALDEGGKHIAICSVSRARCRDWEDIAVGPGPKEGELYVYLGDIGDNEAKFDVKYIYRFPEPDLSQLQGKAVAVLDLDTLAFRYPDGKFDAETLMLDPLTRDLYIITKRERQVHVYRFPYPQSTGEVTTLESVTKLNLINVVGGDISSSGLEILVKTYHHIYYWQREPGQSLPELFDTRFTVVPYTLEPQGESVCWDAGGRGYYTTSEEPAGLPAHLYYYPRLSESIESQ